MTLPFENDTRTIIKRISSRNISANRKRNIFIVLTIALASALLSAIVLYGFGVPQETQKLNQKTAQIVYHAISEQQGQELYNQEEIAWVGEFFHAFSEEINHNDGLKNGHGPLALDSTCMVATKELFQEAMPMIDCFDYSWSIVSDPQKAEQIENSLSAIISSDPDLALDTIGIHKDYEEMENRVVFGGLQALSWLVFLFGVVNLINTTLSNQMSRKRENSVFRAIGLTRKQLCQMTIYEGICYAFFAALATLAAGLPIAVIAARKFSEMTFHGVIMPYSFPFLQMGLFVLVLFGLEVILSFWTMRRQKNQSLVEEMRAME